MKTVLSIDGGGIRGIIPALVLARIEALTGLPTWRCFDLIAGTSTGGILALALAAPEYEKPSEGRFQAGDLADFYEQEGRFIFARSLWRGVSSVGGLADEKYSAESLETVLEQYLGEAWLDQAMTRVIVSAYDIEGRRPFFFKSWQTPSRPPGRVRMEDAARATAAAPTYFEPARVSAEGSTIGLIDGGVCVNNPAMCAYAEARRLWPEEEVWVVSLGTGELTRPIPYDEACSWGIVQWAVPLLSIIFDGVSDAVDYQLRQILGARHIRIQGRLEVARDDMDDASRAQLEALKIEAERILHRHEGDLAVVRSLLWERQKAAA
jgi:hypothetical protein